MFKAYIDLDGILANFVKGAFALVGRPEFEVWPEDTWIPRCLGVSEKEFAKGVDHEFWMNLEVLPDARQIIDIVYEFVEREHCYILSSPASYASAPNAKFEWVHKHFPEFTGRVIIAERKDAIAGPEKILIDDSKSNVEAFINEGGRGILVPRPWNEERFLAHDALAILRTDLEVICI